MLKRRPENQWWWQSGLTYEVIALKWYALGPGTTPTWENNIN